MENKLIRINHVSELTALAKSTIYKNIKLGKFPKPIKFGKSFRSPVMWREDEIQVWIQNLSKDRGEAYAATAAINTKNK